MNRIFKLKRSRLILILSILIVSSQIYALAPHSQLNPQDLMQEVHKTALKTRLAGLTIPKNEYIQTLLKTVSNLTSAPHSKYSKKDFLKVILSDEDLISNIKKQIEPWGNPPHKIKHLHKNKLPARSDLYDLLLINEKNIFDQFTTQDINTHLELLTTCVHPNRSTLHNNPPLIDQTNWLNNFKDLINNENCDLLQWMKYYDTLRSLLKGSNLIPQTPLQKNFLSLYKSQPFQNNIPLVKEYLQIISESKETNKYFFNRINWRPLISNIIKDFTGLANTDLDIHKIWLKIILTFSISTECTKEERASLPFGTIFNVQYIPSDMLLMQELQSLVRIFNVSQQNSHSFSLKEMVHWISFLLKNAGHYKGSLGTRGNRELNSILKPFMTSSFLRIKTELSNEKRPEYVAMILDAMDASGYFFNFQELLTVFGPKDTPENLILPYFKTLKAHLDNRGERFKLKYSYLRHSLEPSRESPSLSESPLFSKTYLQWALNFPETQLKGCPDCIVDITYVETWASMLKHLEDNEKEGLKQLIYKLFTYRSLTAISQESLESLKSLLQELPLTVPPNATPNPMLIQNLYELFVTGGMDPQEYVSIDTNLIDNLEIYKIQDTLNPDNEYCGQAQALLALPSITRMRTDSFEQAKIKKEGEAEAAVASAINQFSSQTHTNPPETKKIKLEFEEHNPKATPFSNTSHQLTSSSA